MSLRPSLALIALLIPMQVEAACNVTMKWGLESTNHFRERTVYADQAHPDMPTQAQGATFRAFQMNKAGNAAGLRYIQRHGPLLEAYRKAHSTGGQIAREDFVGWAKAADPFYVTLGRSLAPVLYFDFVGKSQEYVLDQVAVRTFSFAEYVGGGFYDGKAWYDLVLSKMPGTKVVNVDKNLRFTGSGRAEIKFFSDHYYPQVAQTPAGSFWINLNFKFMRGGEQCAVETGKFMIDA